MLAVRQASDEIWLKQRQLGQRGTMTVSEWGRLAAGVGPETAPDTRH